MNISEYETLRDESECKKCDKYAIFEPYSYKAGEQIENNIKNSNIKYAVLKDSSIAILWADFNALGAKFENLYIARKKLKEQKIEEFSLMSTQEVAVLPIEQKLEYMDALFPTKQTVEELIKVCKENKDNIKACLFNMDFPKSFWDEERKKAARYASLIAGQPKITDKMRNWSQTTLEEKKDVIEQAAEIFEYVYGRRPDIEFFTEEDAKAENKANGLSEDVHINAAESDQGAIYFNLDYLQKSDNFFAVTVMFHEGIHFRQDYETFEDPLVEKMMTCNMNFAAAYENVVNDKKSQEYKDLYALQPHEAHAHGLQEYVENLLIEKTGIQKTGDKANIETKKIRNKAFVMAKIAQYRSHKK